LLWLGEADPVDTMEDIRKQDPKNSALKAIMMEWGSVWGDKPVTVHDMVAYAETWNKGYVHSALRDVLMTVAGQGREINRKRLGNWISSNKGKIVSFEQGSERVMFKIEKAGVTDARQKWSLVKIGKQENMRLI
jgi:putative DNA primase/helicase